VVLVSGDTFFTFVASGAIIPWLPESDAQNEVITRAAAAAAGQFARGGYTTLFDGVVRPWALATFIDATGLDSMHYVVLMPTVDECVRRVTTREGHGFREAANIQRSIEAELYFYARVFDFTPADRIDPVTIENSS